MIVASSGVTPEPRSREQKLLVVESAEDRAYFAEVLRGRRALIEPRDGADRRYEHSAPSALPFDQGGLFGEAVSTSSQAEPALLRHVTEPAQAKAKAKAKAPEAMDAAGVPRCPVATSAESAAAPSARGTAIASAGVGQAEALQRVGSGETAMGAWRAVSTIQVAGEVSPFSSLPPAAVARSRASLVDEASVQSAAWQSSRADAVRRQTVTQFGPVNVVVRVEQGGVQVAARVGRTRTPDEGAVEQAIAIAVRDGGGRLTELHLNGKLRGNRECK